MRNAAELLLQACQVESDGTAVSAEVGSAACRIELRGSDGSANPYLALAATAVAGLDGIARDLDPGYPSAPGERPATAAALPETLLHAVQALRADSLLLKAFATEHPVGDYFADAKEQEFLGWHNRVSDWEIQSYLTAY